MRQKSITELYEQFKSIMQNRSYNNRLRAYFAYQRAFEQHFHCMPHSMACKQFVSKCGKDYKA